MRSQAISTAYEVVDKFEKAIADFAESKYAVAVESCTAALFLCCKYLKVKTVTIPKFTYNSVPCSIIHAGGKVKFHDNAWVSLYELTPYPIIDSALCFSRGMYRGGTYWCLSFHGKKLLPIGRGGMILTDNYKAYQWFKKARWDGRTGKKLSEDKITMLGWNMYMTPEQASRGLELFNFIKDKEIEPLDSRDQGYQDLSKIKAYR